MIARLRTAITSPHAREIGLYLGAYVAYLLLSKTFGSHEIAVANTERIIAAEQWLGIFWETAWQANAISVGSWTLVASNLVYVITYIPLILVLAVVLFFKDRERYYHYRRILFISLALALIVFSAFPMAPPIDTSGYGFVDSFREYGPAQYLDSDFTAARNAVAAMPSMHFAWTLAFGIMFFTSRTLWFKPLLLLYPGVTLWAIVVSGQHFFLDAVAGSGLLAVTYGVHNIYLRRHWLRLTWAQNQAIPFLRRLPLQLATSIRSGRLGRI